MAPPPKKIGWIEAVVFDFDGTIVETVEYETWSTIWSDHGHELALADWVSCVGTTGGFDPLAELTRRVGNGLDSDRLWAARSALVEERWGELEPRPGVVAWIEEAEAAGVPMAVASSADRRHLERRLGTLGLWDRMDAVVGADDAGAPKPDPAVYLLACDRLGVTPAHAVAVEDSLNGVYAAKMAGLAVVAVPNPVTAALDLAGAGADLLLEALTDRSISAVASVLSPGASRPGTAHRP